MLVLHLAGNAALSSARATSSPFRRAATPHGQLHVRFSCCDMRGRRKTRDGSVNNNKPIECHPIRENQKFLHRPRRTDLMLSHLSFTPTAWVHLRDLQSVVSNSNETSVEIRIRLRSLAPGVVSRLCFQYHAFGSYVKRPRVCDGHINVCIRYVGWIEARWTTFFWNSRKPPFSLFDKVKPRKLATAIRWPPLNLATFEWKVIRNFYRVI